MTYKYFYKISHYLNRCNNNIFSNEEVACYAYEYLVEYEESIIQNKLTNDMIVLCTELVIDMDCHDYDDYENKIDIETMEKIFEEFLENYWQDIRVVVL